MYLKVIETNIDLNLIKPILDETPIDNYFTGGYRHRGMSRFQLIGLGKFEQLPPKPLYQSNKINPLENYGGIERHYAELPRKLVESKEFEIIVNIWIKNLPIPIDIFSVHHIRTFAPGSPVPEGKHRDGYEFIGMYVAQRLNIKQQSGETTFWNRYTDEVIFNGVLKESDFVIFDDRQLHHYTSEILPAEGEKKLRDVWIFTIPDHGEITQNYEIT